MNLRTFAATAFRCASLSVAVVLSGCANTTDPTKVADATQASYDPYTKTTSVSGEMVQESDFPNILTYRLRGGATKNDGTGFIQLYVTYWSQSGWYFLKTANDIDGKSLPVLQIDREVKSGANVEETIAITLSRRYVDEHKTSGFNIRIAGQRGSIIVKVPSAYIVGFTTKFDAVMATSSISVNPDASAKTSPNRIFGVNMIPVPAQLANLNGLPAGKGLLVVRVSPNSAAARADLQAGDIIMKFDGRETNMPTDLQEAVKVSNETAIVEVVRGRVSNTRTINFTTE